MKILESKNSICLFDESSGRMPITSKDIITGFDSNEQLTDLIKKGCWYGTLFSPAILVDMENFFTIDYGLIAFRIKRIWKENEKILGDIDILDSKSGHLLSEKYEDVIFIPRITGNKEKGEYILSTFDFKIKTR